MAERRPFLARRPWVAWAVFAGGPAGLILLRLLDAGGLRLPPCLFHRLTGLPCATCGMTRMARAFAAGDLAGAFHWHPVAAALVLLAPLAALADLGLARRGRPFPVLPDTVASRVLVAGLFAATWALQIARGI
ncbi:MAG: DUF2752 domain-containing protein [Holophagaceae bacterium]